MSTEPQSETQLDAYALLSTPTLSITDAQVALIVADLRKRRFVSISTGKPDKIVKVPKDPKQAAVKATAEAKKAAAVSLLASIDWK